MGMPSPSTAVERLMPRLPLSTGLLCPPLPLHKGLWLCSSARPPQKGPSLCIGRKLRALLRAARRSLPVRSTRRVAREAWWPSRTRRLSCGRRSRTPTLARASRRPLGRVCGDGGTLADDPPPFRAEQGGKLLPDGLDEVGWDGGHRHTLLRWEASRTPRMIEQSVTALQVDVLCRYPRKL